MTTLLDLEAIEAAARAPMTFDRPKIHCTHDEERGHAPWCFACDVADRASRPVPFDQRGRGDVIRLVAEVRRLRSDRDAAIALERERCAALVREIPACQPGAKATAARRWLDDRVAACVRAIVVDDETATCARASVRDAMERAKAAEADAARAREAYNIDLAGLRDALRRADDDRAKWRERVADVANERDALRAELEDVRAEAIESERRLNAECSAMDDRDEVYRALRGADDGSDDIVALAEWRMSDLAATRAALRANLRCDECDDLATRCHAATASFCCDAHGVGEGWADTTHAVAVREALR